MKVLFFAGVALFAMVACTAQQAQQQSPPSPQGTLTQHWTGAQPGAALVAGSPDDSF